MLDNHLQRKKRVLLHSDKILLRDTEIFQNLDELVVEVHDQWLVCCAANL